MTTSDIHPTAVIAPGASLDTSVSVGPYTVIGAGVTIGAGTTIGAHVVIDGRTTIGSDCRVFPFASLGQIPQDKKYAGEPCELVIGDRNTIREFCTFNIGSPGGGGATRIGDDNWIMAYVHVAHDCQIGDQVTMANNATLAGHVEIGDHVTVGGLTGIHQFVKVGAHAMLGFSSAVTQDVPPFMLADGNPLAVRGVNRTGLERRGWSAARLAGVKRLHRLLYRDGLTLDAARAAVDAVARGDGDGNDDGVRADALELSRFLAAARRGIAR